MFKRALILAAAFAACAAGMALAQLQPNYTPQVQTVNNADLFQDVVNGAPFPQAVYASGALLSGVYAQAGQSDNYLIGGDAGQNLWQRGTTSAGGTITNTSLPYTADRWVGWSSLTGTTFTVNQVTTAAALPTGTLDALQVKLSNSQTGTGQVCIAQEIASQNAVYLAGHTVELDFSAYAGATWTASALNAYIIYGTSTDEGTSKLAYALNAGGGGSSTWTGQTNATTGAFPLSVSTLTRAAAIATLPSTATEVAVALCFTPSGTSSGAGGTDYVSYSNIELRKADYLAAFANSTTAYTVNTSSTNPSQSYITATINNAVQNGAIPAFSRRLAAVEAALQYQYYWQINEPAASKAVGNGNYQTSTICDVQIPTPVPMRIAPTLTIGGTTESATTWAVMIASTTPVVLASTYLIQDAVIGNTPNMIAVQGTTASKTAGQGCTLVGAGGGANIQASAEL